MLRRILIVLVACMALVSCVALTGCSGLSSGSKNSSSNDPNGGGGGTIPATYWGLIINNNSSYPLQVPYGQFRGWDSGGGSWIDIETCQASSGSPQDPCFDWSPFDRQMSGLHSAGVNDVMYTLSRTPPWAENPVNDPTGLNGTDCNYYISGSPDQSRSAGQCMPPIDLNADGSGANQLWKNWVSAIATKVNDPTYLANHAHIKYWEPWNEWYRSTVLIPNYSGLLSFQGTYAQMVRLTEDVRCTITGKGTIHNYPAAGQSTPCTATAIDPNAVIVSPSLSPEFQGGIDVTQNFLYCSGTGSHAPAPGSQCTTGNAGSQAIDVMNYHMYAKTVTPEVVAINDLPAARAILQAADLAKPMIDGEGSFNNPADPGDLWADPWSQAGFIPRFFALYWSAGVSMNMWYSYDTNIGELYDSGSGQLVSTTATAWTLTYNWLEGATPKNSPFCSANGSVYTCDFTQANGTPAELVWDAHYGQNCSQMSNPTICGNTNYTVPAQFTKQWTDIGGTVHPSAATVTIGANPILLE